MSVPVEPAPPKKRQITNEDSRIPSQSHPCALWRHHAARRGGFYEGRGTGSGAAAEVAGSRREGADSRRRPRQSGRREAGAFCRRSRRTRFEYSGYDAGDAADRTAGPRGAPPLVEEGLDIKRELYLGLLVDRETGRPVFMASASGGMEIEEVAKTNPGAILREPIHPAVGLQPYQARKIAFGLGLSGEVAAVATPFLQALYRAFLDTDASLVEINPCVVTGDGKLVALAAKMTFDDNGLFRHKDLREVRDLDEEDPLEVEASKYGLNYIKLDGTVACMVNGAGLAMATMDIIKYAGG